MRQQPGVDAVHVEGMAAFGQKPQLVVGLELAEADRAVERVLDGADDGLVEEHGEGVDEGLVDAGVVEVEELLELSLQRRRVGVDNVFWVSDGGGGSEEIAKEEVEEAGDEEDDG